MIVFSSLLLLVLISSAQVGANAVARPKQVTALHHTQTQHSNFSFIEKDPPPPCYQIIVSALTHALLMDNILNELSPRPSLDDTVVASFFVALQNVTE